MTAVEILLQAEVPEKVPYKFNVGIRLCTKAYATGSVRLGKTNSCELRSSFENGR